MEGGGSFEKPESTIKAEAGVAGGTLWAEVAHFELCRVRSLIAYEVPRKRGRRILAVKQLDEN